MKDRVIAVGHVLQIYEGSAAEIWLIMISFNCGHAILMQSHHPLGNIVNQGARIVGVILIVLKKRSEILEFIASAKPWINRIVV